MQVGVVKEGSLGQEELYRNARTFNTNADNNGVLQTIHRLSIEFCTHTQLNDLDTTNNIPYSAAQNL